MPLTRRDCMIGTLAAGGALLARTLPAATLLPSDNDDTELRAALDLLSAAGSTLDPAVRQKSLTGFSASRLSPSAAVDLETVRQGLSIDARMAGLAGNDAGDALYALQMQRCLGEFLTPPQAHRLLDQEVQRLNTRADALLRGLGRRRGTVGRRFSALAGESTWWYSDDDTGRDQAVADMNRWLDNVRSRLDRDFSELPPYCLAVGVERMPLAEAAAGKAGYRRLPSSASRGAYVVDLRDIRRRPSWTLRSVVHHELLPGHLLQLPLEAAATPHALRLEYTKAFSEGWATYAEMLAAEEGAFEGDAAAELGQVHWLLFRALRGLIDTGVHHAGWSHARALQTLQDLQGFPAYFAAFDSDIEQIVAAPGLRAAEALVWLRLRAIRASGPGLRQRDFHRIVLQSGRKPLAMIAREVRAAAKR